MVTFAYITGWRVRSEVLPLEWRQVDFKAGKFAWNPGTTKNKEGRTFPFTQGPARRCLEAQHAEHQRLQAKGTSCRGCSSGWWRSGVGAAAPEARRIVYEGVQDRMPQGWLPGRIPHDFRRTAVRNLERAGVPRSVAMKLTGHRTESVYRRYAIADDRDLRVAVERLDAATSG